MTSVFSPSRMQICVRAAARQVMLRLRPDVVCRWLGCSDDTERRLRLDGPGAVWRDETIWSLMAAERSELQTDTIFDAIAAAAGEGLTGDSRAAVQDLADALPDLLSLGALASAAIRDRVIDPQEHAALRQAIPIAREVFARVERDLIARETQP